MYPKFIESSDEIDKMTIQYENARIPMRLNENAIKNYSKVVLKTKGEGFNYANLNCDSVSKFETEYPIDSIEEKYLPNKG